MVKKIVFIFLVSVGIVLRLYQINSLPAGLFLDEVNMAVDAKALAQNGVDQYGHPTPFYFEDVTDFKLPVYVYTTAFFFKIFGPQIITVHITSALAGIFSIFLLGYLARLLFPDRKYIFGFAAVTLALSPLAIHFSRIGYETNLALCLLLIYLIALISVLQNKRYLLWLCIGSIATLLACWTYPAPKVIIPLFTMCILVICWIGNFPRIRRKNIALAGVFLIVCVVAFIPTILFPYADARQLRLVSSSVSTHTILPKLSSVFASYIRLWNLEFLFNKGDVFAYRHGTKELGVFLLLFILPFLAGVFWVVKKFSLKNFSILFLLLFALIAGLPSSLSSPVPYGTRVIPMLIPYSICIALGIGALWALLEKQRYIVRMLSLITIACVLIYQIGLFSYVYFVDFAQLSLPEFPSAPFMASSYVKSFHQTRPTQDIYFLNARTCFPWGVDALHLWYFADLPNAPMIAWNNAFRKDRYSQKGISPFDAYDTIQVLPEATAGKFHLFAGYNAEEKARSGDLLVTCGYQLNTMGKTHLTIKQILYMYQDIKRDPYYVIVEKK